MKKILELEKLDDLEDERIDKIEKHIEIINEELGGVKLALERIKTDIHWLKWFLPPLSILTGLGAALLAYLLK